jgi:RimJ/RimL family protein N-acetyltransferase
MHDDTPIGPEVDATPRGLPTRTRLRGRYAELEPLHRRHVPELWQTMQGADGDWSYLGYGPFASEAALARFIDDFSTTHDPMVWAIRPVTTGLATGWLSLLDIQPRNTVVELGHIWLGPALRRTRAATEAMFLLLRLAADDLGYRRLCWKCNALNAPSRRAAGRLGFVYEGTLRTHLVVKGRRRDTAYFSILDDEWPRCRDALMTWLDPSNFAPDGTALRGLGELRGEAK